MPPASHQPSDQAVDCPAIQIKAPDAVSAGTQARVSAILAGGPRSPQINWTLSAGRIASGQHTPELVIDTRGLSGASITATLEIGGLSTQCATNTASTSILIGPP
jgi:hypothetical protein